MKKFLPALCLLVLLAAGCQLEKPEEQSGMLKINLLLHQVENRTIVPDVDMRVSSYEIFGYGPNDRCFELDNVVQSPVLVNKLAAGDWLIHVHGINPDGKVIAAGEITVTVIANTEVGSTVVLRPLEGTGLLELDLSWPDNALYNAEVRGVLTPVEGTPLEFTIPVPNGTNQAHYETELESGYYMLQIKVYGDGEYRWGLVETVRILACEVTSGLLHLTINPEGELDLGIVVELDNPVAITLSGAVEDLCLGEEMSIEAITSEPVDAYQWYLDGEALEGETSNTLSIGSGLLTDTYRLDLVVKKGNVLSSTSVIFNVKCCSEPCDCLEYPCTPSPTPVLELSPVLEWEWTGSGTAPDYKQVMSAPVIANLNDDNGDGVVDTNDIPDVIINTFAASNWRGPGVLRALSGDGSGEIFALESAKTIGCVSPAVGDLDGDGLVEIAVLGEDMGLLIVSNTGVVEIFGAASHIGNNVWACITLADLEGDGSPEIIVGNIVYNNNGTLKWQGSAGNGEYSSIVADIDLDGSPELIAGNTVYDNNGNIEWQNPSVIDGFTAVADFDLDGYPEIVNVFQSVTMFRYDGEIVWQVALPGGGRGGAPTIADYDNDGVPEIGVAGQTNYVVFEGDGTVKWSREVTDYSSAITGSSVFDFEGDGNAEVVYADEQFLWIFRGLDGATLAQVAIGSGTLAEMPIIADVDNDGSAEIIVPSNDYVYGPRTGIQVFGDAYGGWAAARRIWSQHSYHFTNVDEEGNIPQNEVNSWDENNSYRQNH
ncbi:MAG: VCBS repeat-containing protein [Spirochaetales bacterium]|nr:VCBS repeat-containing protein [Spirochaetales bacterium]